MRHIHPAAWAGLLLNFVLAYVLFSSLADLDLSVLHDQEREFMESIVAVVEEMKPLYYGSLGVQVVSLGLVASGFGFGMALAIISAFFMLPASMFYLVGCALTHFRVKYAAFYKAPAGYMGAHFTFPSSNLKMARVLTGALLLAALAGMLLMSFDVALAFLGMSLGGVYCTVRASKNLALSLHDEYFTVTPALFADRLLVPYDEVRRATLNEDETISFEVEGPAGPARLRFPLRVVRPEERRAALEELAAALNAHGVPLY
jgi:hypothetical protein